MSDDEIAMMISTIMVLGIAVVWLLVSNRRLKRRMAQQEARLEAKLDAALSEPTAARALPAHQELDELRKRVQVLERIATDDSPKLARDIEALRHTG